MRMKTQPKTNQKPNDQVVDFAPGPISKDTAQKHFERGAGVAVDRNRWFAVSVLLAAALIANAVAWNTFLPLKSVETFQVNKVEGGRLVTDSTAVGSWAPDSDSVAYFINKWANSVFDVNRATLEGTLAESGEQVVGNAKSQLTEMRKKDNPLVALRDYPSYNRNYEFITINFIKDDVALLRFRTTKRYTPETAPIITTHAMTVTFTRVKPTTRAQIMKNPAGLFITNFNATEESVSK